MAIELNFLLLFPEDRAFTLGGVRVLLAFLAVKGERQASGCRYVPDQAWC